MVEGLACAHSRFIVLHHYQLRYKFLLNNKPYGTIYTELSGGKMRHSRDKFKFYHHASRRGIALIPSAVCIKPYCIT